MEYELLTLIAWFAFGWFSHSAYMAYKMRQLFNKIAKENGLSLDELVSTLDKAADVDSKQVKISRVPNLFTELIDNSIMLYSKDTGKFLGQAETVEALAKQFYDFNKVRYALVKHESQEFWFVEGKVKNNLKDLE
jgi:hypothetical protein